MSNDDGLPPELAALLDAERAAAGPSAAVKARVLSRLEHTLGLSDGGDGGEGRDGGSNGGGSAGSGSSASSASSSGLHLATPFGVGNAVFGGVAVAVTVLGLVAGVLVGVFGGERELSSRTAADVANTAERAPAPDRDPDRAPDRDHDADRGRDVDVASDDDGFVIDESELRVEADPVPSERPLRAPAPRSESSTLSEEQALLDAARGALAAGELSVAE